MWFLRRAVWGEHFGLILAVFGSDMIFRTACWTRCLFCCLTEDRNALEETQNTKRDAQTCHSVFFSRGIKMLLSYSISQEHQGCNPLLSRFSLSLSLYSAVYLSLTHSSVVLHLSCHCVCLSPAFLCFFILLVFFVNERKCLRSFFIHFFCLF